MFDIDVTRLQAFLNQVFEAMPMSGGAKRGTSRCCVARWSTLCVVCQWLALL